MSLPICVCLRRDISFGESKGWQGIQELPFRENVTGGEPQQGTGARCAHGKAAIHVLITSVDREPWATITKRDGPLWEEEVVEIFIDPFGDLETYFEIEVNPLNTVVDLVLRRNRSGYRKDFSWDCEGLRSQVALTQTGWTAEFLIPFASITAEVPDSGAEWRVNFCRIDRPRNQERELSAWSPTLLGTFHVPEAFGRLQFG